MYNLGIRTQDTKGLIILLQNKNIGMWVIMLSWAEVCIKYLIKTQIITMHINQYVYIRIHINQQSQSQFKSTAALFRLVEKN